MQFDSKKPNLFMRGTDAIVAFPKATIEGDVNAARELVAHIFSAPLKTVCADMGNKNVPEGKFYVWRIKQYKRPDRLHQPDSTEFMAWNRINVIPDENEGKPETPKVVDISKMKTIGPRTPEAKKDEPEMVLVNVQDLKALVAVMESIRDEVATLVASLV